MGMGAADVVPGVSGGTIAFITGIYEELIYSIKSINLDALKLFFTGKWKSFWKQINGNFLLAVFAGVFHFGAFTGQGAGVSSGASAHTDLVIFLWSNSGFFLCCFQENTQMGISQLL